MRPIIAIPMDYLDSNTEEEASWYSKYPWYAIRHKYNDSLVKFGALPCFIGYNHELIPEYIERFDGLLIGGGHFDHEPEFYNQTPHETIKRNYARSNFEKSILEAFLKTKKPVLGICGGHQLINIIYGGTLHQDIASMYSTNIKHCKTNPPTEPAHKVKIVKESKLYNWYKAETGLVNSSHHQNINLLGKGLVASSFAEDGLIESIEDPNHPFCVGVQWHPEYLVTDLDETIIKSFVKSCV